VRLHKTFALFPIHIASSRVGARFRMARLGFDTALILLSSSEFTVISRRNSVDPPPKSLSNLKESFSFFWYRRNEKFRQLKRLNLRSLLGYDSMSFLNRVLGFILRSGALVLDTCGSFRERQSNNFENLEVRNSELGTFRFTSLIYGCYTRIPISRN
jgi:hypothetical protein